MMNDQDSSIHNQEGAQQQQWNEMSFFLFAEHCEKNILFLY